DLERRGVFLACRSELQPVGAGRHKRSAAVLQLDNGHPRNHHRTLLAEVPYIAIQACPRRKQGSATRCTPALRRLPAGARGPACTLRFAAGAVNHTPLAIKDFERELPGRRGSQVVINGRARGGILAGISASTTASKEAAWSALAIGRGGRVEMHRLRSHLCGCLSKWRDVVEDPE